MAKIRNISPGPDAAPASRRVRLRVRPRVWLSLLFLVGLGFVAHLLWQRGAPIVARQSQYQLTADAIHITPTPPWIRSDIKPQLLRDAGLPGSTSVLEDWTELSRRVKDAFERHPWVGSVERITCLAPAGLDVELKYRRPIAAVESKDEENIALLPIDRFAVRLPEADLPEDERRRLPRISGIVGRPPLGKVWNDPRVIGGAKLIAALADVWQQLRLVEVLAAPPTPQSEAPACTFVIVSTGGTRIVWGAEPGHEPPDTEEPFGRKRQRLLDYAAQHGRLESIDGPESIDVRRELVITPRTARARSGSSAK